MNKSNKGPLCPYVSFSVRKKYSLQHNVHQAEMSWDGRDGRDLPAALAGLMSGDVNRGKKSVSMSASRESKRAQSDR